MEKVAVVRFNSWQRGLYIIPSNMYGVKEGSSVVVVNEGEYAWADVTEIAMVERGRLHLLTDLGEDPLSWKNLVQLNSKAVAEMLDRYHIAKDWGQELEYIATLEDEFSGDLIGFLLNRPQNRKVIVD